MSITYALIDTDGRFEARTGDWRADVGPEGPDRVRLYPRSMAAGWVNDCGHTMPDTYPRNIPGSVLLIALGAVVRPYAGPVVITGWDPKGVSTEVCSLPETDSRPPYVSTAYLESLCMSVRRALRLEPGPAYMPSAWCASVRDIAERVRAAPTPTSTSFGIPKMPASAEPPADADAAQQ